MWRSKKVIIAAVVLAALVLVGGIGGVALAQTEEGDNSQPKTLMARVAEILGIDQQKVEDAFTQARTEMREETLDNYLKKLVDEGTITQEQADQYKTWVVEAKPDLAPYQQQLRDWQQTRPDIPPELKEWQEARPDIPLPGPFGGFGGRGFHGGMKEGGGGCFWGR